MKYYRTVLIYLLVLSVVRILNGNTCGTLSINPSTTAEGNAVQMQLITYPANGSIPAEWRQETKQRLCNHTDCLSNRYKLSRNAHVYTIRIENVVLADAGTYRVRCQNDSWSNQANLFITEATTSARNKQVFPRKKTSSESTNEDRSMTNSATAIVKSETVKTEVIDKTSASNERELHQKTISTESTKEYHSSMTNIATAKVDSRSVKAEVSATTSARNKQLVPNKNTSSKSATENRSMTNSATAKVESEMVKTKLSVSGIPTDSEVSSTLEGTSQVITVLVGVGIAVVLLLHVIVVLIVYKKRKTGGSHRARQKPDLTHVALEGMEGQVDSVQNDYNGFHRRDSSGQDAPTVRHKQKNNSDGQKASGVATEQSDSKYETIIPVTDRDVGIQKREMYEVIKEEEEGATEYETIA